jgi:hypothetical protein
MQLLSLDRDRALVQFVLSDSKLSSLSLGNVWRDFLKQLSLLSGRRIRLTMYLLLSQCGHGPWETVDLDALMKRTKHGCSCCAW